MSTSYFFLQAEKNIKNSKFLDELETYVNLTKQQVYVVDRPLTDNKYSYDYKDAIVLLMPKYKILFIDFGNNKESFEDYVQDFIEDLGSISDKFQYKKIVGRPRSWKEDIIEQIYYKSSNIISVKEFINVRKLTGGVNNKKCELLISLLTGSINDIEKIKENVPESLLDKVKQKIILFDGDQTRFIYQTEDKKEIKIQGLSGTGKTELLLHKLKDIYINYDDSKIVFTCHNKILAHNLKKRIPEFFNFMKVEQQIKWNERLWCIHAWGSKIEKDSGTYSYICNFYKINFLSFNVSDFDTACTIALQKISLLEQENFTFAFDFILIDESQDFPKSFFELCKKVTKHTVYVAGDIFQTIFDENLKSIEPDFLLSNCYRTDPKTLMFGHSLGMGLFESPKIRWLEDEEWKTCGYILDKDSENNYNFKREPIRRFEDLQSSDVNSIELVKFSSDDEDTVVSKILQIIHKIKEQHPTVLVDDIGIIFINKNKQTYILADQLEFHIPRVFGWEINKAYESKEKLKDRLFISNTNNVKGLEFPFVICVCDKINNLPSYRNSLYMTLTRSFIQTYLLLSENLNAKLIPDLEIGLKNINENGYMKIIPPSLEEMALIRTTIKYDNANIPFYDRVSLIFDEIDVEPPHRDKLYSIIKHLFDEKNFDLEKIRYAAEFNYRTILNEDSRC